MPIFLNYRVILVGLYGVYYFSKREVLNPTLYHLKFYNHTIY